MNADVKKLWVEALRSGAYRQTRGNLRDGRGHCCLGVLCDIHAQVTGTRWLSERNYRIGDGGVLPVEVKEWAGLDSTDPGGSGVTSHLSVMNDDGVPFKALADIIDTWEDDGITHAHGIDSHIHN